MRNAARRFLVTCFSALLLWCGSTVRLAAAPRPADQPARITVSAAASLKDAFTEIARDFERQHPGVDVALNFGASGALELQIEQGAPVDVFVSASSEEMDKLAAKKLLRAETRVDMLRNELVMIAPRGSGIVTSFGDLKRADVRVVAVGDPRTVPAGMYAQQVLMALGMYDSLKSKMVLATDVRQVLADVETGSAEAGFVYATDAAISPRVRVVAEAPQGSHQPIVYPAVILRESQHPEAARAFLDFLLGPGARAAFTKEGFRPVTK